MMTLSALLDGITEVAPRDDREIRDITLDSREAGPGSCFFALRGARADGIRFAGDAAARGAVAVVAECAGNSDPGVPVIAVPDLRTRLGRIADRFFCSPSTALDVYAVTGTNGKTSVAYLVARTLDRLGVGCGYIGTLGSGRVGALDAGINTTPDVVSVNRLLARFRAEGCGAAVVEASSHALDQGRLDGIRLAAGAFTNLGHDHLDYHGDRRRYARSKRRLFEHAGLAAAVVNIDDPLGAEIATAIAPDIALWTCSSGGRSGAAIPAARVRASGIVADPAGIAFDLTIDGQVVAVTAPLLGRFNVDNLLVIAGILSVAGHSPDTIAACFAALEPVPGRMQRCGRSVAGADIVVDFAHSPDSLDAALAALRELGPRRLHVVFGCGGERDASKRGPMGAVAARHADRIIVTSDNPRGEDPAAIARAVLAGIDAAGVAEVIVELDRRRAIEQAVAGAGSGDIVLIAGKGHETTQERCGYHEPFDDRIEVRRVTGGMAP